MISRIVGDVIETRCSSSGTMNDDQVLLAEKALDEIDAAQRLAAALGSPHPVVKVDQNGIGHGVVSMLKRWADTGRHQAPIVGFMVSDSRTQDDPGAVTRPYRKRDEMWLAQEACSSPTRPPASAGSASASTGRPASSSPVRASAPTSAGYSVVESKKAMKQRGMKSPDRADAALLTVYEPEPIAPAAHSTRHASPSSERPGRGLRAGRNSDANTRAGTRRIRA
ncbi:hypothetical protein [Streptomyces sp. NPDC004267]|uniref:hypothetical protein n=1 Tax=Streptomyces sp. NPDC004267 TaxID=3364694 RepID=UPI0036B67EC5